MREENDRYIYEIGKIEVSIPAEADDLLVAKIGRDASIAMAVGETMHFMAQDSGVILTNTVFAEIEKSYTVISVPEEYGKVVAQLLACAASVELVYLSRGDCASPYTPQLRPWPEPGFIEFAIGIGYGDFK